jgi:hypothetical protein
MIGMIVRADTLASILPSAEPIHFTLGILVLIVAVILQLWPVLPAVMMASLASDAGVRAGCFQQGLGLRNQPQCANPRRG